MSRIVLTKSIRAGKVSLPAGTALIAGKESAATIDGKVVKLSTLPSNSYVVANEALLRTKGSLAIDSLVAVLRTILKQCPAEDKPMFRKVMNAATKACNSAKADKVFEHLLGLDKTI